MGVVVYGVVNPGTKLPRGTSGIDGARPRVVSAREAAAVVGDLDRDELVARRRDLRAHMDVLAAALERSTVIPMRFGEMFRDDDEVAEELLVPLGERLRELLDRFENLVEFRVSARYDERALLAEIVAEDAQVRRLRGSVGAELQLGELVAAAYDRKRGAESEALLGRLLPLVVDEAEADGREWNLLTASFLVHRAQLPAFEGEIERWAESLAGRATVELAGPLPPYSFVELEMPEAAWA